MIPIGDIQPRRRMPLVTYLLILVNVILFMKTMALGPSGEAFVYRWGAVPARLAHWPQEPAVLLTLLTSTFLHGGWFHLIGNMLYLGIFGDNVEDRLGYGRYLLFYLVGGVLAGIIQAFFTPDSPLPAIGASGAVAAVLGAYLVLFPHARVLMLVPLFFWMEIVAVPSSLALGLWFFGQFFNGLFSLAYVNAAYAGGIAWWAHVGGFLVGVILTSLLERHRPQQLSRSQRHPYGFPQQWY